MALTFSETSPSHEALRRHRGPSSRSQNRGRGRQVNRKVVERCCESVEFVPGGVPGTRVGYGETVSRFPHRTSTRPQGRVARSRSLLILRWKDPLVSERQGKSGLSRPRG